MSITYRHPTDTRNGGKPVTVERDKRDGELEHYGWVELDGDGNDVRRGGDQGGEQAPAETGGDARLDERTDPKSTRHDAEQVENEKPRGNRVARTR